MISVARKAHMPSRADSFCCAAVSKWCSSSGPCAWPSWSTSACVSANFHLRLARFVIRVSFPRDHRGLVEVEGRRWRRDHPLQSGGSPRVSWCGTSITERPYQVDHRKEISESEHARAGGGHDVEHPE